MPITPVIKLAPDRRRMAQSMDNLFSIIAVSDSKKYAKGKPFLPIFPTDNTALLAAITLVKAQLNAVLNPT